MSDSVGEPSRETRIQARLTLADRALNQSVEKSQTFLELAEAEIRPGSDAADLALALRCQIEHRSSMPAAGATCGRLIDAPVASNNRLVQAYRHATLTYYYYREGQHGLSLVEAERTLAVSEAINDHGLLAAANNMVGLHFGTKLRPRMSLPHFEMALEHARQLAYPEFKMIIQLNLASSYTYLGRAREALQMLEEAKASSVVDLYPTRRLVVQSMIAQARVAIGDTQSAASDLTEIMDEVRESVLPDAMTFGYTGLGLIQLAEGKPGDALASFNQVLDITGQTLEAGLEHPRIQLMAVPYASALRQSGQFEDARRLLQAVVKAVPPDEPDQLLVDANKELALSLDASGDTVRSREVFEQATLLESRLWDASFRYQIARLNSSLESDRRKIERELSQERETALREKADRETTLRRQSWLIGAMLIAVAFLLQSRRLQKRIADTERAANARLEEQVTARTHELEAEMAKRMKFEVERRRLTEQMSEGEKMRALGQLTAGVAHDFNNLMTVVKLGADQLKTQLGQSKETPAHSVLGHIVEAADTGAKITRGLLAYVRKQPLQPEVVELGQFLESNMPIFRNTLGERIEFDAHLESCHVLVDRGQLTTSLLNLFLNAKEAMPNGGTATLKLRTVEDRAEIEVSDSGTGMAEDIRQRAFDPFFTTKEKGEGTGLGLSMVYGFAHQSDGNLVIASEPERGTAVTLSLPLIEGANVAPTLSKVARSSVTRQIRVLAVEDRHMLLHVLKPTLEQFGMDVIAASNADEALKKVALAGLPDLVISDIVMPGKLDGLGLVAQLRKYDPNLPVVLMSGYSKSVDEDCTFLRKPFSVAELEEAIDKTLDQNEPLETAT